MADSVITMDARARVEQAAEAIIRKDGAKGLTMRRLAAEAGVALKTPYNLFGSKTGVMIALLDRVTEYLMANLDIENETLSLVDFVHTLDRITEFYESDEDFYRAIFWEVIKSDDPEARSQSHGKIILLVTAFVNRANASGEFKPNTDPDFIGAQLGLNLLANLGLWAGGHLSIAHTIAHTKAIWISVLVEDAANQPAAALHELMIPNRVEMEN